MSYGRRLVLIGYGRKLLRGLKSMAGKIRGPKFCTWWNKGSGNIVPYSGKHSGRVYPVNNVRPLMFLYYYYYVLPQINRHTGILLIHHYRVQGKNQLFKIKIDNLLEETMHSPVWASPGVGLSPEGVILLFVMLTHAH